MKFDAKVLKDIAKSNGGTQYVDYSILVSDTEITKATEKLFEAGVKTKNHACFANLPNKIKKGQKQYVIYHVPSTLNATDTLRWFIISKINKTLPDYLDVDSIVKNGYAVLPLYKHNLSALFVYLTTLRVVVEFPRMARLVLYLYDKCKLDYYTCILMAFKRHCSNGLHFYMPSNEGYPYADNLDEVVIKYDLLYALVDVIINLSLDFYGTHDNDFNVGKRVKVICEDDKASEFSKFNTRAEKLDLREHFRVISAIYASLME